MSFLSLILFVVIFGNPVSTAGKGTIVTFTFDFYITYNSAENRYE